jgi:hypothetical protein
MALLAPALSPGVGRQARSLAVRSGLGRRFFSLDYASIAEWTEMVGSTFQVTGGYALKLVGVRPLISTGHRPWNLGRDRAFLAVFDVLGGLTMADDLIYSARHPRYGAIQMYLNAAGDTATLGRRMHAVFN